jgi:YD repeat-containing protein
MKTYSDCTNPSQTALTAYYGYNADGNLLASVDAVGAANPSLYANVGCSLSSAPPFMSSAWTAGRYTACTIYDSYQARPVSETNALGQTVTLAYDYTQGGLLRSTTDVNGQTTSQSVSYNGANTTTSVTLPLETASYTYQETVNPSSCTASSSLPCYEVDTVSSLYPNAISRTFYDALGRAVETRMPGQDTVVFTVYDDSTNSVFQSVPFQVASGSGWVDPNGAVDINGQAPVAARTRRRYERRKGSRLLGHCVWASRS